MIRYVEARAGDVFDRYVGPSISMFRARLTGELVRTLLTIEEIAAIDLPPAPDVTTAEALDLTLANAPPLNALGDDAPLIGVIDSGVNDHPFLANVIAGSIAVPENLGTADVWGHGTRVAGIAVFGDLRAQLNAGALQRGARICAAKVVNDRGEFDDRRLVPSQMREAIMTLNQRFGCRVFVIALADRRRVYDGGKVGTWAATLDELARELDVVIVVSSGNRHPRGGNRLEQAVTEYPGYLLEDANRFFEPAGALNVITVGALAHGEGLDAERANDVRVRPITKLHEPAPFSRTGPGPGGATKPDVVEIGGTLIFDPVVARLRGGEDVGSAGVLTLYHSYLDQLFTAGSGTSYAAPRVPEAFQAGNGERCIRVTLAFDPPVRHTRNDYAGVGMSFRLVRGCQPDLIFDHYRKREQADGPFPELAARYNCNLVPGPQAREKGSVQCATATFRRDVEEYGDDSYLVVRCESGWATHIDRQQFALVVELLHKAEVQLYERVRQRIRIQA